MTSTECCSTSNYVLLVSNLLCTLLNLQQNEHLVIIFYFLWIVGGYTSCSASHRTDSDSSLSLMIEFLLISTVDIITVDDLSSAQIKRLKNYLQTILSSVTSPTKQQREKITPLKTDILKQEQTIPVQKTRDVQLTEESPETNTQEVAIDKLLRKFTAESMKQGKRGDCNSTHCNAFSLSGRNKRWQG